MRKRGSVFILALLVLVAATAVLALAVASQRVNTRASLNRMEKTRARFMCESAVQRALAELANLLQTGAVDQTQDWSLLGSTGAERFSVGGESFRLQIIDAGSLVSLNSAPEAQLQALGLTQSQIDSLLDWREEGDQPRTEGAKNEYYNGLTNPYNAAKQRLWSVDETLLIKDWLPSTLLTAPDSVTTGLTPRPLIQLVTVDSFCPNTDGTGQRRQNINSAQQQQLTQAGLSQQVAQAIIARRNGLGSFTGMSQVMTVPGLNNQSAGVLLDRFAVNNSARLEGRVNLNTATEDVLATLPGIPADVAQAVFSRQSTGMANLSEVLQIPGVSLQTLQQIADSITVGSDTFIVRCEGTAGSTREQMESVVQIINGAPVVVKTLETPKADMTTDWGWPAESSTDTVLGEDRR